VDSASSSWIVDLIRKERHFGVVRCGVLQQLPQPVINLAAHFNLSTDPECYRPVSMGAALEVVERLLHKDLAYGVEIMLAERAAQLAHSFICELDSLAACYTNGGNSATKATFDEGVLVIGMHRSGCFWVEDED
jgi:hypothetical protein